MKIDITKIVGLEGSSIDINCDVYIEGDDTPVHTEGKIYNMGEQYVIKADMTYLLKTQCARCLEPVERLISFKMDEVINADSESRELFKMSHNLIDITDAVYTNLEINLPTKVLCKDDCKGLCFVCGTNLNKEECNCNREQTDPRFEVLKKLINKHE